MTVTEDEALRWHQRLGHLNRASLNKLLNFPSITLKGNVCEICAAGKIAAKPFPQESRARAKEPLELIQSDVMCIGAAGGAVVRALALYLCGPGFDPGSSLCKGIF